jgi:hypothetical protein
MKKMTKRLATVVTAGSVVLGGMLLAGGVANAMPSNTPCGASDVHLTITRDASNAAGHEAYDIIYTAASPTTNCELQGTPTAMTFIDNGRAITNMSVTTDSSSNQTPVNLRAGNPAVSRIIQRSDAAPNHTPTTVTMDLPTGPYGEPVTAAWPAAAPLKGNNVEVTAVSAAN